MLGNLLFTFFFLFLTIATLWGLRPCIQIFFGDFFYISLVWLLRRNTDGQITGGLEL